MRVGDGRIHMEWLEEPEDAMGDTLTRLSQLGLIGSREAPASAESIGEAVAVKLQPLMPDNHIESEAIVGLRQDFQEYRHTVELEEAERSAQEQALAAYETKKKPYLNPDNPPHAPTGRYPNHGRRAGQTSRNYGQVDERIMHIVPVLSGKGGVGKTTTCFGMALALQEMGHHPGILDLDLENPSVAGKNGVTGLTREKLTYPDELMVPPRWMGIPIMSISLMLADGFENTPTMLDEKRKHFLIRHLIGEVDWSSIDVLVVDMPPGTGEEVRGLLQLGPTIAVVVTAPQLLSEGAVRKVVEMASEYRLPLLGFVENQHNGVTGEAGIHLAEDYGLPLLVQIPWTPEIPMSMDVHEAFDHQIFLPVAEALIDRLFFSPATEVPPISEDSDLLRQAEAWVSGRPWEAPAPPPQAPGVYVGADLAADIAADIPADNAADMPADISAGGEPGKVFHEMTDDEWEVLQDLLPEEMRGERARFNGILWIFTTENRWRDMPTKYGKFNTARNRVQRLRNQRLWEPLISKAQQFGYALAVTVGEFLD
ncbi:MAG: P-loop NTPase [Candidatus Neomarinimicrobiota bacterium]